MPGDEPEGAHGREAPPGDGNVAARARGPDQPGGDGSRHEGEDADQVVAELAAQRRLTQTVLSSR